MSSNSLIRDAEPKDVEPMLEIYGPVVLNTAISFEYEVPDPDQFWNRIEAILKTRPWLVCQIDDRLAGYAYASSHRIRRGYDWCSEVSVYVHPRFQGRGVARALYTSVLEILNLQGYRNAYAVITVPNDSSLKFHESMGFKFLTVYPSIGFKLGKWHDVEWWSYQFKINDSGQLPRPYGKMKDDDSCRKALANGSDTLPL